MKLFARLTVLVLLSVCCTGCFWYWHLRNPSETPPQLKVLYLNAETVDSHFKVQLQNLLESMRITQVKNRQAAPYTLHAFAYSLAHDNPPVASTNVAITYTYTLSVTVSVENAAGVVIVPAHTIVTTREITVNVNQIFTINSTSVFQQDLQREAINLIYYWLTSDQTRKLLSQPTPQPRTTHAIESVTANPAP